MKKNKEKHKEEAPGQKKEYNLIINGRPRTFEGQKISFNEVVRLAYETDPYEKTAYTITYQKGKSENSEGRLVEGDEVSLKPKMIFNVTATDKS